MTIDRVAFLSIHTSPLAAPGSGDAGGMNVYIDELARTMAVRGVSIDVFTRAAADMLRVIDVIPGYRVIEIPTVAVDDGRGDERLADLVGDFADGVVKWSANQGIRYDVVHSHYWLSGWAGVLIQDVVGVPLAISFHTLGRVKAVTRRDDEPPPSLMRIAAETEVIARAGCVVASTPIEAGELLEHYGASPERLCVSPPGVDHDRFGPGDRRAARARLGIGPEPIILFAGRIQPLKALDVSLAAFEMLAHDLPSLRLVVVGGPSGPQGDAEITRTQALARHMGVGDRLEIRGPLPHDDLSDAYRAANVLHVPSRSESFGLVAVEAQACGLPVVASRVGGLPYVVADDRSGLLVSGWDPADHAVALHRVLTEPETARRLGRGALERSERFSWSATADRLLELYSGIQRP
ncbi:MAG TPA: glycosyltransferase [Acidimicrobiia bacterium]|nr:glycosyltransferase [Acidimicrobiia bacterium]